MILQIKKGKLNKTIKGERTDQDRSQDPSPATTLIHKVLMISLTQYSFIQFVIQIQINNYRIYPHRFELIIMLGSSIWWSYATFA